MGMEDVDDHVFRTTDEASVALLRGLRAGTVDHSFIHRADVCSAVPEELVADLQPVPGTEATDDGYNSVWYIYCPKRYKNSRGEPRGHRQRAVEPAKEMCWHSETGPKPVQGVPGATVCDLSYGRMEKEETLGRRRRRQRFERMGWTIKEFDDTQGGGGDHVLCRVHRTSSSLAKSKFMKPSSSSSSSSKRKAAGDHPEAPPTKLSHDKQVQVQMQQDAAAFFNDAYQTLPCYGYGGPPEDVDLVTIFGGEEEEHGVQQPRPRVEFEAGHLVGGEFNVEELLNMEESEAAEHRGDMGGFNLEELLNTDEQVQQDLGVAPVVGDVEPEHGGDLGEFSFRFQDLLNTDGWKGFEDFLAEGEQGLQQPRGEPEQQGGVFLVQGHAAVC